MPSLTVETAQARAAAVTVRGYQLEFDLTTGDKTFGSTTTIWFAARSETTFVDVKPDELVSVKLNGVPVDIGGLDDGRLPLSGLAAENELVVVATMAYSRDGEGMQRSVDPTDDRVYVYGMSSLESAPRYFACFDQPDLKAPYRVTVRAPEDWIVLGNGPATQVAPGRWEIAETKPLSTYFVTVVAGPFHLIRGSHDGIPLGLGCRQSLAKHLDRDADELFAVTARAFDEYHRLFGYRYPFGEYHQVFVPDFNLGAMENPGCVTFSDDMVYRSAVTDAQRSHRARVVVHELAHMWFGDTVTMRWWNDLWLNESFAEYMAYRVGGVATDYTDHWTDFAFVRKWWGLQADQRSSTHPVAAEAVKDARASLDDFDGISYAKGAAVLKQLVAYLGDDVFLAGVRAHIAAHEFGNADLHDLLRTLTEAGAVGLDEWASNWLRTAGLDTISAARTAAGVALHRAVPTAFPADRPHRLTVGAYDDSGRGEALPVLLAGDDPRVELDPSLAVVVPDAEDDTWAKVRLDEQSLQRLAVVLPRIGSGVTRAAIWNSIRDAAADAELDPALAFDILLAALPQEDSDVAVGALTRWAWDRLLGGYLPVEPYRERLAEVLVARLGTVEPGSSVQLAVARGLVTTTHDFGLLQGWLRGDRVPAGLAIDLDLRWSILWQLAGLGEIGEAEIDAELARDRSAEGVVHATRCRAALPTPEAKERAWALICSDAEVGVYQLFAACEGFWFPGQAATAPYVERYFSDIRNTARIRSGIVVTMGARRAFPRFAVDEHVVGLAGQLAADPDVATGIRRAVDDMTDDVRRAVAVRAAYPSPAAG